MRILHYIPLLTKADNNIAVSVRAMLTETLRTAENHLLMPQKQLPEIKQAIISGTQAMLHTVDTPKGWELKKYLLLSKHIKKIIKEVHPDVVHIHACWDYPASVVEKVARNRKIITIVSPHGLLTTQVMEQDFMKKRLPRLLAYQNKMVRRSTSLLAMTTAEHEEICQTGMRAATRIETLETADGLLSVYRKALDSYYYNYITNEEKAFVSEAVRKAELPKETENLSFRRIFLYAWDEDVMPQLLEATNEQDIAMPPVPDIEKLSRYKNKKAKQRGALIDVNASVKKIKIPTTQQTEYAAVMLINKAASIGLKQLTLRHWLELNQLLHNVDFNEDVVAKELKRLGLKKNTRKIQKTLAKYYALPEGYNIF